MLRGRGDRCQPERKHQRLCHQAESHVDQSQRKTGASIGVYVVSCGTGGGFDVLSER